jgi:hypothetical protein
MHEHLVLVFVSKLFTLTGNLSKTFIENIAVMIVSFTFTDTRVFLCLKRLHLKVKAAVNHLETRTRHTINNHIPFIRSV